MAQLTAPPAAPAKAQAVEDPLWRPLDDGGWELLSARKFQDAREYFQAASEHLGSLPANDYRRGRTKAGLAWTRYRLTQLASETASDADLEAGYREAQADGAIGAKLLREFKELPRQELIFRARAQHVLGLCLIELCRGAEAVTALQSAAATFADVQEEHSRYEVLHLLGKLLQCRRQFAQAVIAFRQIKDEADNPETQLRALIDLANTLLWMGNIRAAWSLQAEWRRLDARLRPLPEKTRPVMLLLRGRLLFARVNVLYGDFAAARGLLDAVQGDLCGCGAKFSICRSVFWIISAELALEQGQLQCALQHLNRANEIDDKADLVDRGYSCLDLVAIDAGCRRCVIECCTHECFTCCGPCRTSCRIVFTTENVSMQPLKYKEILLAIISGLAGRLWLNAGQMTIAAELLRTSRAQIETLVHPHSPLLFQIFVAQTQLAADRFRPHNEFMALVQHLLSASLLMQEPEPRQPPLPRQPTPYTLAHQREFLAETCWKAGFYEAAESLWLESLGHSQQFRTSEHPVHDFLALRTAMTAGIFQLGPHAKQEERQVAQRAIEEVLDKMRARLAALHAALGCDDYHLHVSRTLLTWLWLLACPRREALGEFLKLEEIWYERDVRWGWDEPRPAGKVAVAKTPRPGRDPRQALALLGTLAVRLQYPDPVPMVIAPQAATGKPQAKPPAPPPSQFERYFALLREHQVGNVEIARELERFAELLEAAEMNRAAQAFRAAAKTLQKPLSAPAPVVVPQQPVLAPAPVYGIPLRRWRRR